MVSFAMNDQIELNGIVNDGQSTPIFKYRSVTEVAFSLVAYSNAVFKMLSVTANSCMIKKL